MKRPLFFALLVIALPIHFVLAQPELSDDTVLLSRGDVTLTYGDWKAHVRDVPVESRADFATNPLLMAKYMDNLWTWKVLAEQARDAGFDQDPDVAADLRYATEKALGRAWLYDAAEGARETDYAQQAREHYLIYEDEFVTPELVTVSHIVVSIEGRSDEEALARAEEIRTEVVAGARPFAELAVEYSDEPRVEENRGLVGTHPRGRFVKEFEDAAFALTEPGQVSEPVRTRFGYHIIVLNRRVSEKVIEFEEVRAELEARYELQNQERSRLRRAEGAKDMTGRELNVEALRLMMPLDQLSARKVFEQAEREAQLEAEQAQREAEQGAGATGD